MEYEFCCDENGRFMAEFGMGAEAFGNWFSEELGVDPIKIQAVVDKLQCVEQGLQNDYEWVGTEFTLRFDREEVEVKSQQLLIELDSHSEEELEAYDQESEAFCGLQDFKAVLLSWQQFVTTGS